MHDITGASRSEIGHRAQKFAREYTDKPEKLIGPLTSIGFGVAGVFAAFVLILFDHRLLHGRQPEAADQRDARACSHPRAATTRISGDGPDARRLDSGGMQGVIVDMFVTGVLLYIGLSLIGLDYALVFSRCLSAHCWC